MAFCKKCGSSQVEWVKENSQWFLFNLGSSELHGCKLTPEEYDLLKKQKERKDVCKHGILKDRPCDLCEEAL